MTLPLSSLFLLRYIFRKRLLVFLPLRPSLELEALVAEVPECLPGRAGQEAGHVGGQPAGSDHAVAGAAAFADAACKKGKESSKGAHFTLIPTPEKVIALSL